MKKHTDIGLRLPEPDTEFDFHGLRVVVEGAPNEGCDRCFFHHQMKTILGRGAQGDECDEAKLPLCDGRRFIEAGFNNEDEFKVWQVIRRMGLEDEN